MRIKNTFIIFICTILLTGFVKKADPDYTKKADWFYSLPEHEKLVLPAEKIYQDYLGALKYGNIFSLDIGPNYEGRIRDIDVKTLKQIGRYIKGEDKFPENWDSKAYENVQKP